MTVETQQSFLGVGWAYPIQLDASCSRPLIATGEALVHMSIEQIINTDPNEWPFRVKDGVGFGTRVRRALFEPMDVLTDIFRYEVPRALRVWEPRIIVLAADADVVPTDPNLMRGSVRFRYRVTNREDNFVRPYRLKKPETQQ